LRAWADSLGGISYPLLSDFWPHGEVAECYGVLRLEDGFTERAIFVIDSEGFIRYIDIHNIADQPDNEEVRTVLRRIEGKTEIGAAASSKPALERPGEIILYCAKWCRDCVKIKSWLEERSLSYVEIDIDYDPDARKQVREWCGGKLITPVVDFKGTIIIDFDVAQLEMALNHP
jgi:glutaredoxin